MDGGHQELEAHERHRQHQLPGAPHNETDELFILLNGKCTLLFANETEDGLKIEAVPMEPLKVYNIPRSLWHNTVTQRDTKLALIEDSSTGSANSDNLDLTEAQIEEVHRLVKM